MDYAIETERLTKCFGTHTAVDGISLRVPRGSCYGFLGPNGAGKSTTIKCLTGLLTPTGGSMRVLGLDALAQPDLVTRHVGVVPEGLALFDRLTGAETLAFVGSAYGLDGATLDRRARELLGLMELSTAAHTLVADYSHGMRKKLSLGAALLPAPSLLFLDEPFEGVDPVAARQIKALLSRFVSGGGTIFLTTHILEIVERLCDHVGVIQRGTLVAQGATAELCGPHGTLEEAFMDLVGATSASSAGGAFDWLVR
jgi:ABC-2 type transport system ATP-binding protein